MTFFMGEGVYMRAQRKKLFPLLSIAVLLLVLFTAFPKAQDDQRYDVTVTYDDHIQITYNVLEDNGKWRSGPGDIQLGKITDANGNVLVHQIYCAAATVPFHEIADVPDSEIDHIDNYTIAIPAIANLSYGKSERQILWLVANGYAGEAGGLSDSNLSVINLNSLYANEVGGAISPKVALIATKIAIWHYTDPTLSVLSATLDKSDYDKMLKLVKALVRDADAYGSSSSPLPGTQLSLSIDDGSIAFSSVVASYYYVGPFVVDATLINANNSPSLERAYLSLSGRQTAGIEFVADNSGTPLNTAPAYGQSASSTPQPYVDAANNYTFYLKVPATNAYGDLSGLSILALGKVPQVDYQKTPQFFVYSKDNGFHDYHYVQAFVGLLEAGTNADIYDEAKLSLKGGPDTLENTIRITKVLKDAHGEIINPPLDASYTITLTPSGVSPTLTFVLNADNDFSQEQIAEFGETYTIQEDPAIASLFDITYSHNTIYFDTPGATYLVQVTNQPKVGELILDKALLDARGIPVDPLAHTEVYTLTLTHQNGEQTTVTLSFPDDWRKELLLPVGDYTITEVTDGRSALISPLYPLTIADDSVAEATLTNQENNGSVTIFKQLIVDGAVTTPAIYQQFEIVLTNVDDSTQIYTVVLQHANDYQATIKGIPPATYSIIEASGSAGYQVKIEPAVLVVTPGADLSVTITNQSTTIKPKVPTVPLTYTNNSLFHWVLLMAMSLVIIAAREKRCR
jgi:hypothetical protein